MERIHMRRTKWNSSKFPWANLSKYAALIILLTGFIPARSLAQEQGQKTFSSPQEAAKALVAATQSNDEKAMLEILGIGLIYEEVKGRPNFVVRQTFGLDSSVGSADPVLMVSGGKVSDLGLARLNPHPDRGDESVNVSSNGRRFCFRY